MLIKIPIKDGVTSYINTADFQTSTTRLQPANFSSILTSVMLADTDSAAGVTRLSGHVRIPDPHASFNDIGSRVPAADRCDSDIRVLYGYADTNGREGVVQLNLPARAAITHLIADYYEQTGAKEKPMFYTQIVFRGRRESEWQHYGALLVDYINYILPYMLDYMTRHQLNTRADQTRIVCAEKLIYADHLYAKTGNTSFHLIYNSDTSSGFTELWSYYLRYLATVKAETKVSEEESDNYRKEEKVAEKEEKAAVSGEENKSEEKTKK